MHRIAIKIEGIEKRKKSTGLLHIVAGLFLLVNAAGYCQQLQYQNFLSVFPFFAVAIISLIYGLVRTRIDPNARFNHWVRMLQFLAFSILGILMLQLKTNLSSSILLVWAVICILLLFTERKVFHDAFLLFSQNTLTIPGYFSNKVIPWTEIENIIVRPDYVTLYYPENRYMQYELLTDISESELKNINHFCQQKLQQKQI